MTDKPKPVPTIEELAAQARSTLRDFFHEKARTNADIAAARIASSLLSTFAREKQAAGAADALNFMMARELASDKAQLEQFLAAALPSSPIMKALPAKKES